MIEESPSPRLRKCHRVVHRELIAERVRVDPAKSLGEAQVRSRRSKFHFVVKVGHVNDQGVALPVAARVSEMLTDSRWMRALTRPTE
jgi:hypothetical protein